jgi:uncharacterized repeat protein (TIGR03803 family)
MPQAPALAARTSSTNYKVVYSFSAHPDGRRPEASLIDVGGTLYGTTRIGGAHRFCYYYNVGCGTVFSVTPGGKEKVLYRFRQSPDGSHPLAGLINVGGTLYGTTSTGGSYGTVCSYPSRYLCGTVFSVTPSGTEKVLHAFGAGSDGSYPVASLVEVNGAFYGTTKTGGVYGGHYNRGGTVFSITPSGAEKVLHSFGNGNDGSYPLASLIALKGKLYGTTWRGGTGAGTVFSITPSGEEKVLFSFGGTGTSGVQPEAGLINVKGTLYGTTTWGGGSGCASSRYQHGCGTVFSVTPRGTEKVLHSFGGSSSDGEAPEASLTEVNGMLYGTTSGGGTYGKGTVFSITTSGAEKVLHSFGGSLDGSVPVAGLIDVRGTLYGTTYMGGAYGDGSVFALTP